MITDRGIYKEYEAVLTELEKVRKIRDVAVESLKMIIQSGQVNIADRALETIKEIEIGKEQKS